MVTMLVVCTSSNILGTKPMFLFPTAQFIDRWKKNIKLKVNNDCTVQTKTETTSQNEISRYLLRLVLCHPSKAWADSRL